MKGCEAWVALCASNTTQVAQCTQPGPVPKLPSTMLVREAINSLCSTHYMDGCYECELRCTLARVCVNMQRGSNLRLPPSRQPPARSC